MLIWMLLIIGLYACLTIYWVWSINLYLCYVANVHMKMAVLLVRRTHPSQPWQVLVLANS